MGNDNRKGPGGPRWNDRPAPTLPSGYLSGGYYETDEGGKPSLRRAYIVDYSKDIANKLQADKNVNKSTQLRKYYDYCIRIRDLMNQSGRAFAGVEGEFARLIPFVQYAQTRKRVSPLFVEFIEKNVNAVHSREDFQAFLKHFEAVVAYLPKDQ